MTDTITIEVPKSEIQFDIGGGIYTLSLADKSRGLITEKYREIEKLELANAQHIQDLQHELQYKLSHVKGNLSDYAAQKREQALQADYTRKFNLAADKAEQIGMEHYLPFLDVLFGEDSGQKIYAACGENIAAVNKVIGVVMVKMNAANDVSDYMSKYAADVEAIKAEGEGSDEPHGEE
ncbi:hypothetical protein [Lacticaseibacillus absianus]|uniref:hypothetical protein n=1 Tax=Lacticaseibacillus absianus TaxID=2729623 RepID=UPI0015C7F51A|nr:hypothetical protein [Lacticaseibacillus absianus]